MAGCHPLWGVVGVCLFVMAIISSILLGCSFSILEPLEYGLEVNGNTKQIQDELFRSGRYFVGLGHYFERFPRDELALVFLTKAGETAGISVPDDPWREKAIACRTSEGMRTNIGLGIQYKLGLSTSEMELKDQIMLIFERYGTSWEEFLVKIASEAVRNVTTKFTAFDLFQRRKEVGAAILVELKKTFALYYFECMDSVLLNVGIDDTLQNAIQETEIVNQQILEMQHFISAKQIESNTKVLIAETTGRLRVDKLNTDGLVYKTLKQAEAQATVTRLETEKDGLVSFETKIGFTTEEQSAVTEVQAADTTANNFLLSYFWIQTVDDSEASMKVNSDLPSSIPLNIS